MLRVAQRRPVRRVIESLEGRRLLAAPTVAIPSAAQASDYYTLTADGPTGAVSPTTPLSSIDLAITNTITFASGAGVAGKAVFSDFKVTLPSGPMSVQFFNWSSTGRILQNVRIFSWTAAGQLRETWTLGAATVDQFRQSTAADGTPEDTVAFGYSSFEVQYRRLAANGDLLGSQSMIWNLTGGTGSTVSTPYVSNYIATSPAVSETVEFAAGQTPSGDSSFEFIIQGGTTGGGGGSGKPVAMEPRYTTIDGPDSLYLMSTAIRGLISGNVMYSKRNPTTGLTSQRYRLGSVYVTGFHISDTANDSAPRLVQNTLTATTYQLENFAYSGVNNLPSATSAGFDYSKITLLNPAFNSAQVDGAPDSSVSAPINSVTFRFLTPVTFNSSWLVVEGLNTAAFTYTSADGGLTWTVGNLAGAQTTDGRYAIGLLADKVNALATTAISVPLFTGSAGKSWKLDRVGPSLIASAFTYDGPAASRYAFHYQLSEPISAAATDGTALLLIRRADTGALVANPTARIGSDGVSLNATLGQALADGRYTATLPAGSVRDPAGNLLGTDLTFPFFVLAGDADHNGTVNFADLVTLAQNYNKFGLAFSQGNFDYSTDGRVDFADLVILAQNYSKTLPALALPATGKTVAVKRSPAVSSVGL